MNEEGKLERLDRLTAGMLWQRREDRARLVRAERRIEQLERATLELAAALREAGIQAGELALPSTPPPVSPEAPVGLRT